MTDMDEHTYYPAPEGLREGFSVRAGPALPGYGVNFDYLEMTVPLGNTRLHQDYRDHEMAHVKWTPADLMPTGTKAGIRSEYLNAVEDCRIHHLLEQHLDRRLGFEEFQALDDQMLHSVEVMGGDTTKHRVLLDIASIGTGRYQAHTSRHLGYRVQRIVKQAWDAIQAHPTPARTLEVAAWLQSILEPALPGEGDPIRQARSSPWETGDLPDPSAFGTSPWGSMEVIEPARTQEHPASRLLIEHRAYDVGTVPRYMHRACTDARVFSRRRKIPGGTILVDASGSMSLEPADIDAFLDQAPAALVAGYCGGDYRGRLVVLAKEGRRISDADIERWLAWSGNVVDGPALRWMADQAEPRLWVSDEGVTGAGDSCYEYLHDECMEVVDEAGIHIQPTLDDAIEFVGGTEWLPRRSARR